MSFVAGQLVRIGSQTDTTILFTDFAGQPADPTDVYLNAGPVGTFDPSSIVPNVTWHFQPPSSSLFGSIHRVGVGIYYALLGTAGKPGPWEAKLWGTGTIQASAVYTFDVTDPYSGWPFPFGYCGVDDVQARINAGSWDPSSPASSPTNSQVVDFIREASSMIDAALMGNGFFIPLVPRSGFTVIMPQAWLLLRTIAAELVTSYVEQSRHGGQDTNVDASANAHRVYAEELLQKIGARSAVVSAGVGGAAKVGSSTLSLQPSPLNLYVFGADGEFPPEPDKSKGMRWTGTAPGQLDAWGDLVPNPITLGSHIL